MDIKLYDMIFKRKSFHLFRATGDEKITESEIADIEKAFYSFDRLNNDIKVEIKITKDGASCARGQEYLIMFYSEKKDNYLQNIGYLGEQLDLYLVSKNIGTLWFGIGKAKEKTYKGLDYVILIAIKKIASTDMFRKDMFKSKRKEVGEMWEGEKYLDLANIARFAPSACNSQPWIVTEDDNKLTVYRYHKEGKRGIMPKKMVNYYNQIDIGIFLVFLELILDKNNIKYERSLFIEENSDLERNKTAEYTILE